MATTAARIDDEAWSISRTVSVAADRAAVWAAITGPELISEWFGQTTTLEPVAVGGTGFFGFEGYGDFPVLIVEFEAGEVFSYRWGITDEELRDDNSTVVRYTLAEGEDGGTLLTVVETGFDRLAVSAERRRARLEENRDGWDSELDELVVFLERS